MTNINKKDRKCIAYVWLRISGAVSGPLAQFDARLTVEQAASCKVASVRGNEENVDNVDTMSSREPVLYPNWQLTEVSDW